VETFTFVTAFLPLEKGGWALPTCGMLMIVRAWKNSWWKNHGKS